MVISDDDDYGMIWNLLFHLFIKFADTPKYI